MWATMKQWRLIKWEMIWCAWMLLAATVIDPQHRLWHLSWLAICLCCYAVEYWLIGVGIKLNAEIKKLDMQIEELDEEEQDGDK